MENRETARTLGSLMLLDFDQAHAFEEAIENTDEPELKIQFNIFRRDHQDHVFRLSKAIIALGAEPPAHSNDFRVFATTEVRSPRQVKDSGDILEILLANEKLLNERYADAMGLGADENIMKLIQKNFTDEQKHLAYVQSALNLSPLRR